MPPKRSLEASSTSEASEVNDASSSDEVSEADETGSDNGENGGKTWTPPAPEENHFRDWALCDEYVEDYFVRTYQPMRIRSTVSVETYNASVIEAKEKRVAGREQALVLARAAGRTIKQRKLGGVTLHPVELERYNRSWVCTHVGKYKTHGDGKRTKNRTRAKKCKATLSACLHKKVSGGYNVRITSWNLEHTHRLSASHFASYPKNRMQMSETELGSINLLRERRTPTEEIHRHIFETTSNRPRRYDTRNLIYRMRRNAGTGRDVPLRVQAWVDQFVKIPGNLARIFHDKNKLAQAIVFQTLHMRRMAERYGEIVMIDATHDTNSENYKLLSLMVIDAFGGSQFIQHAFIENERKETLATVIRHIKETNRASSKVKCFMIDKDFTEIAVLREEFPDVAILLCQFHAVKYLREVVSKYDLSAQQKTALQDALGLIVYAKSEEIYTRILEYIKKILMPQQATREGVHNAQDPTTGDDSGFLAYFMKNWHQCRSMWCSFERNNVVTMTVNTNNRLEATWRRVKALMRRSDHIDETLRSLTHYQRTLESDHSHDVHETSRVVHADYDENMKELSTFVTDYAAALIYPEYQIANRVTYKWESEDGIFKIRSVDARDPNDDLDHQEDRQALMPDKSWSYEVQKRTWTCSCMFMSTTLLPCRHVVAIRLVEYPETPFPPPRRFAGRWLLKNIAEQLEVDDDAPQFEIREALPRFGGRTLKRNERFNTASELSARLCSAMAEFEMPEFTEALSILESVKDYFVRGELHSLHALLCSPGSGTQDPVEPASTHDNAPVDALDSSSVVENDSPLALRNIEPTSRDIGSTSDDIATSDHSMEENSSSERDLSPPHDFDTNVSDLEAGVRDCQVETSEAEVEPEPEIGSEDRSDDDFEDHNTSLPTFTLGSSTKKTPKTKAKKQIRADRYHAAKQAVDLLAEGISYATYFLIDTNPDVTLKRMMDVVSSLKVEPATPFLSNKKPAKPTAMRIPSTGVKALSNYQIFHVLPSDIVEAALTSITRYQDLHPNVPDGQIVVKLPGRGVYFSSTMYSMRRWHLASKITATATATYKWFTHGFNQDPEEEWLQTPPPLSAQAKLDASPFFGPPMALFDYYGKSFISDEALSITLSGMNLRSTVHRICSIEEASERKTRNRTEKRSGADRLSERDALNETDEVQMWVSDHGSRRWLFFPVFFSTMRHWTVVCVDREQKLLYFFEPSGRKKLELETIVKLDFLPLFEPGYRVRYTQPFLQKDSYNCGVFVLMFAEYIIQDRVFPEIDKKLMQQLRYRYLCLGL